MTSYRSTTGCWTCKLRKKKCDESKPACVVCSSLTLDCSGYGPRPEWMDNRKQEKDMLSRIRAIVKDVTREKKRAAMRQRQPHASEEMGASLETGPIDSSIRPPQLLVPGARFDELPNRHQSEHRLIDGPPSNVKPKEIPPYISQNEPMLLMHYLDKVFPCQFQFYQHSVEDGGRGWLLSLLLETKPFHHAACSLAAYHRQTLYSLRGIRANPYFTSEAMGEQYDVAITELRKYLDLRVSGGVDRSLAEDVQMFCCTLLFVSLEAFISRPDRWHMHLTAAMSFVPCIYGQLTATPSTENIDPNIVTALSFFTSDAFWIDAISCATTGLKPCDLGYLEMDRAIDFQQVMGCENWVMLEIRNIATLRFLKTSGQLNGLELASHGQVIEESLNHGFSENLDLIQHLETMECHLLDGELGQKYTNACVTRIYISAALTYLHTTTLGSFPALVKIQDSGSKAIQAFKAMPNQALINHLIWPMCIVGCMASSAEEKDFFRGLGQLGDAPKYGVNKAKLILEECWRLRGRDPGQEVDWKTAMESLEFRILLK